MVDAKDIQIHEQNRKIQSLEETCQDLEGTIVQFRELVLSLQTYVSTQNFYDHLLKVLLSQRTR